MAEASRERLHSLDALRGGALLMGVALHASIPYVPGANSWILQDAKSPILGLFYVVTHMYRMLLFFLIAGFFGRLVVERRGALDFARDRARRIALPFLAFWPIMLGLDMLAYRLGAQAMRAAGRASEANTVVFTFTPQSVALTHLWFLYVLSGLYVAALALRAAEPFIAKSPATRLADRLFRRAIGSPLALAIVATPLLLTLDMKSNWISGFGIPTPDHGLVPNLPAIVGYASAFAFGWLLQPQADILKSFQRRWIFHLAIAALLTGVCVGVFIPLMTTSYLVEEIVFATSYALAAWAWVLGLLGLAQRFLVVEQPQVRYLADASYWIYIIHLPVVMGLQLLLFPLPWPALAKFAVVTGVATSLLLASYALLVRGTWLGAWLNGRRRPAGLRDQASLNTA